MTQIRILARAGILAFIAMVLPIAAAAAPFASFVMDGRTGKEIQSQNADTRLHPASLTKMMTLYMAFTAIERGQVRLDTRFTVSSRAAAEPPSRLGLRAGQKIELRYLIRAAAVKSGNDAATAIAENLGGSVPQFAAQMTAMAQALGMRNTQFRNAHGLTQEGHFSTARDMSLLGRRLFYDFPQYYSIFSRRSADAGVATVSSTNRAFLDNYPGADGIKTGYTRAAGFNLTASAQRGSKRIIATVFGGTSTAQRNAVMAELLNVGFGRAPTRVKEVVPEPPQYIVERKSSRKVQMAAAPAARPRTPPAPPAAAASTGGNLNAALNVAMAQAARQPAAAATPAPSRAAAPARLARSSRPAPRPGAPQADSAAPPPATAQAASTAPAARVASAGALGSSPRPKAAPRGRVAAGSGAAPASAASLAASAVSGPAAAPPSRQATETVIVDQRDMSAPQRKPVRVVSRASSSGGQRWKIDLGRFETRSQAEDRLLQVAVQQSEHLSHALRRVDESADGFTASFVSMSPADANRACANLVAQSLRCAVVSP